MRAVHHLSLPRTASHRQGLVVALHADQAAEAAVRFAAERGKAFAVVPCCAARMDGKN